MKGGSGGTISIDIDPRDYGWECGCDQGGPDMRAETRRLVDLALEAVRLLPDRALALALDDCARRIGRGFR